MINSIRAHLAEFGIVAGIGRNGFEALLEVIAQGEELGVPPEARSSLMALAEQLELVKRQILEMDRRVLAWHRASSPSSSLEDIPGIGPLISTPLAASVPDPKVFRFGCDLSAVPMLPQAKPDRWSRLMHLKQGELPVFPVEELPTAIRSTPTRDTNDQDARRFAEEGERVKAASPPLHWRQPSLTDPDRSIAFDVAVPAAETTELTLAVVGAGRLRGLVLHKLMEELITGEVEETEAALIARAALLLEQLSDLTDATPDLPRADELGRTALATIRHPKLAGSRTFLVAEVGVGETTARVLCWRGGRTPWSSRMANSSPFSTGKATELPTRRIAFSTPRKSSNTCGPLEVISASWPT